MTRRRRGRRRSLSRQVRLALGVALALVTGAAALLWHLASRRPKGPPILLATDRGTMRLEEDYLPGVVDCELALYTERPAALEAQAIAARTYVLRHLELRGPDARVPVGPSFQCWREPRFARSRRAVERTRGQVLRHRGRLTSGSYASGADHLSAHCAPPPPREVGYAHDSWEEMRRAFQKGRRFDSYAWTEIFVTDNRGRTGDGVRQTSLAARDERNRGAMGQYRAICLAERQGLDRLAILRSFYGEDVELSPHEPVARAVAGPDAAPPDAGPPLTGR